jgi:hypothetical protein
MTRNALASIISKEGWSLWTLINITLQPLIGYKRSNILHFSVTERLFLDADGGGVAF